MGFATAAEAESAFYRALSTCNKELMRSVWRRAGDVTCIHPFRAPVSGYDAIIASWDAIFAAQGPTRVLSEQLHIARWRTSELRVVKEYFEMTGVAEKPMPVIATNAYERSVDGWHMILHHGSPVQRVRPAGVRAH